MTDPRKDLDAAMEAHEAWLQSESTEDDEWGKVVQTALTVIRKHGHTLRKMLDGEPRWIPVSEPPNEGGGMSDYDWLRELAKDALAADSSFKAEIRRCINESAQPHALVNRCNELGEKNEAAHKELADAAHPQAILALLDELDGLKRDYDYQVSACTGFMNQAIQNGAVANDVLQAKQELQAKHDRLLAGLRDANRYKLSAAVPFGRRTPRVMRKPDASGDWIRAADVDALMEDA